MTLYTVVYKSGYIAQYQSAPIWSFSQSLSHIYMYTLAYVHAGLNDNKVITHLELPVSPHYLQRPRHSPSWKGLLCNQLNIPHMLL